MAAQTVPFAPSSYLLWQSATAACWAHPRHRLLCNAAIHAVNVKLEQQGFGSLWLSTLRLGKQGVALTTQLFRSTLMLYSISNSSSSVSQELVCKTVSHCYLQLALARGVDQDACMAEFLFCNNTQPVCNGACCVSQDLGWSLADTEALCTPSTSPAADAAAANGIGKPATAARKASAAASADKTAPATAVGQIAPMSEEIVFGFQTPCHVAAVQCHKVAANQLKADLTAAVLILKDSMYAWQQNEAANKERWANCLRKLEDVV